MSIAILEETKEYVIFDIADYCARLDDILDGIDFDEDYSDGYNILEGVVDIAKEDIYRATKFRKQSFLAEDSVEEDLDINPDFSYYAEYFLSIANSSWNFEKEEWEEYSQPSYTLEDVEDLLFESFKNE